MADAKELKKQQKAIEKQKLLAQLAMVEAKKKQQVLAHAIQAVQPAAAPKAPPRAAPKSPASLGTHPAYAAPPKKARGPSSKQTNPQEELRRRLEQDQRRRREKLFNRCEFVLKRIKAHKWSWPFQDPVDIVALNIPDYPTIVKTPMDLGTVHKKLGNTLQMIKAGHNFTSDDKSLYLTPLEFDKDVRLVFTNCFLYNKPGSDVRKMAEALLSEYESKWAAEEMTRKLDEEEKRIEQEERDLALTPATTSLPTREYGGSARGGTSYGGYTDPMKQIKQLEHQVSQLQNAERSRGGGKAASGGGRAAAGSKRPAGGGHAPAAKKYKREMTFEDKRILSEQLSDLPQDKLAKVVEIIAKTQDIGDDNEIELDIDQLDLDTLWELHKFVNSHKKQQEKTQAVTAATNDPTAIATTPGGDAAMDDEEEAEAEGSNDKGPKPEEPAAQILEAAPAETTAAPATLANAAAWTDLQKTSEPAGNGAPNEGDAPKNDQLWNEYQERARQDKQREEARKEEEEANRKAADEEKRRQEEEAAEERRKAAAEAEERAAAERAAIEARKAAELAAMDADAAGEDLEAQRTAMQEMQS